MDGIVRSVLAQDYEPLELVISDNASTDGTEEVCRALAAADPRVTYHRHPENVGILRNFDHAVRMARGEFFKWVGDDDWIAPNYISRCMEEFGGDDRLVLVTTQLRYIQADGRTYTYECQDPTMRSEDPITRFEKLNAWLTNETMPLDPMYGLARRAVVAAVTRENMIREDEVFAGQLALAGP